MISSHSSSFMRASRLSRVMPALLTRMAMSPNCFWTSDTTDSDCRASLTFSTRPPPWMPAPASSRRMPSAPAAVVAVPATTAPLRPSSSAIERPMPRDAPVTSAIFPSSVMMQGPAAPVRAMRDRQ